MNSRVFLISGLVFMVCAVALGAFGAHGLEGRVSEHLLQTWKTAAQYQVYHALGLIGLGLWAEHKPMTLWIKTAGGSLIGGVILFCGSLYTLVLSGETLLGIVTPFGGLAFITGWFSWMMAAIKS
jgi:uncharacterized membrane protein YgdD (TMEM256/DUF423 family)